MSHEAHEVVDGICRQVLVLSELQDGGAVVRSAEPGAKVEAHEAGAGRWHSIGDCGKVKHYPIAPMDPGHAHLDPPVFKVEHDAGPKPAPRVTMDPDGYASHSGSAKNPQSEVELQRIMKTSKPAAKKASEKKR